MKGNQHLQIRSYNVFIHMQLLLNCAVVGIWDVSDVHTERSHNPFIEWVLKGSFYGDCLLLLLGRWLQARDICMYILSRLFREYFVIRLAQGKPVRFRKYMYESIEWEKPYEWHERAEMQAYANLGFYFIIICLLFAHSISFFVFARCCMSLLSVHWVLVISSDLSISHFSIPLEKYLMFLGICRI